ncbi:MAG: TolC family protein [Chryseobacterium sp.]
MKNNHKNIIAVLVVLFSVAGIGIKAQTPINLQTAINTALENNRNLKNERLKSEYSKALIKSSNDIPQTGVSFDYGQINSAYNDMKFGISQNIAFPTVYKKQKNVYTEEWKKSLLNVSFKEYELKKAVSLTFYNILYWKEKEKLLRETLKLYTDFLDKANIRLKAGESNILEKTTAANQKSAIEIQLKQLQQELSVLGHQFQWLLNTETDFMPEDENKINAEIQQELNTHPFIKMLQQQKSVSEQQTALEKAKLLPGLQIAYNLNSFRGMGADDKIYSSTPQFHSVQLGVLIPVFSSGQKAKIQAAKIAESVAENDLRNTEFNLQNQLKKAREIYQSNLEIVSKYENFDLQNADVITETAKKQFIGGDINYLEFVILVNQSVQLKNNYTDAVWKLNQSAIELEYLTLNP